MGTLVFVLGCESSPSERLQGHWVGDSLEQFEPAHAERAAGWAKGTSFRFEGRRVTVVIPTEPPRRGTFEIANAEADQLEIRFLRPHGQKDQVSFEFISDDRLRWRLDHRRSIVLRKAEN
jgi:hypothetical protein